MESPRVLLKQNVLPYVRSRAFVLDICALFVCLLLGRVEVLAELLPFGLALCIALDMAGQNVYYPALGAAVGMLLAGVNGYFGVAAIALYLVLRFVYPLWRKKLTRVDKLLLAAVALGAMLPIFYIRTWTHVMLGLTSMALTLLLAVCFQNGIRALKGLRTSHRLQEEEQIALCLLIGAVALALCDISVYAFSLGIVLVAWAAMFSAHAKGLSAVAAAVLLGGVLLLGGRAQPLLLADLALCTLCAVACRRLGIWGAVAGFCICCMVTESYFGSMGMRIGMINALPAAAVFALLPKRALLAITATVDRNAREERTARAMLDRLQTRAAEDIQETAATVEQVAALFPEQAGWSYDSTREMQDMQRAAYHVCADCSYRGACWRNESEAMQAVDAMLLPYGQGMRPRPTAPLRGDCAHTTSIAAAAAQARDSYREHCTARYYAAARHAFANRQLNGVSRVMRQLSSEVLERGWPDEGASQNILRRLEREGVPVRGVLLNHNAKSLRLELRLGKLPKDMDAFEDVVTRAAGFPVRLLRSRSRTRETVLEFERAPRMRVAFGVKTVPKPDSPVSGDSAGHCALPDGRVLFVLSDGMGSGHAAQQKSKDALDMLKKLYRVGYERDASLECVNRLLMGKQDQEMYATLDALHLNIRTGDAEFIKCGAPPAFVLREGEVHSVYGEALPAGMLDEALPAVHAAKLRRNDVVVLMTDGAVDSLGADTEEEIKRLVGGANTCQNAADALLESAYMRGACDDMTVMVVRLE